MVIRCLPLSPTLLRFDVLAKCFELALRTPQHGLIYLPTDLSEDSVYITIYSHHHCTFNLSRMWTLAA